MQTLLLRFLGHRAAHRALAGHTNSGGALDIHLGLALLRDRRVPIATKVLALMMGAAGMALLVALELPVETLLALLIPALGLVADAVLDGLESVVGPFIVAALLMPYLAPAPVVEIIRNERAIQSPGSATG